MFTTKFSPTVKPVDAVNRIFLEAASLSPKSVRVRVRVLGLGLGF